MDNFFWFLIIIPLATARIARILSLPEKIAVPLHLRLGGKPDPTYPTRLTMPDTFLANLVSCYYCVSVWVATLCLLVWAVYPYALLPFAVSALAIVFEERR